MQRKRMITLRGISLMIGVVTVCGALAEQDGGDAKPFAAAFALLVAVWLVTAGSMTLAWLAGLRRAAFRQPAPARRPASGEPPRRRGNGDLIERLCRKSGWVVTRREGDHYQIRSGDHRPAVCIEVRYSQNCRNIVMQSWFPVRFSLEKPPAGLFARVLLRSSSLVWGSWTMNLGPNCDAALVVAVTLHTSGLTAELFRDVCEEIAGEIRAFTQELHDKFAYDLGGVMPEATPWEVRGGVPARRGDSVPGVW